MDGESGASKSCEWIVVLGLPEIAKAAPCCSAIKIHALSLTGAIVQLPSFFSFFPILTS